MAGLPRYHILRRLGSGATGGVYLAQDRVLAGPPVALKCLNASSDPTGYAMLVREFAVLSSLSLPGVAPVYDLGSMPPNSEVPAGPFFTRAYVEGEPLDRTVAGRPLVEAAELFLRVLEIVSGLHRAGIVHGDLKPTNIIVDANGAPQLIDFGLASRATNAADVRGSGTPLYMAPELFQGAEPTAACDVYALGATLWGLALGRPPFSGPNEGGLRAKLSGALPHCGEPESALARALLQAATSALQPERSRRIPSADELSALVERALALKPRAADGDAMGFVLPRPRGREQLLAEIEQRCRNAAPARVLVRGELGMGKSTLLRELKWRLQLAFTPVLEVPCRAAGADAARQLLEQVALLRPGSDAAAPDPVDALVAAFSQGGAERPVLLLDDFDAAHAGFRKGLLALLHEQPEHAPHVIAAVEGPLDDLLFQACTLAPLSDTTARELVRDVLQHLDPEVVEALVRRAEGNPGRLVEALGQVAQKPDLTAPEVAQLPRGEVGESLTCARMAQLSDAARTLLRLLAGTQEPVPDWLVEQVLGAAQARGREELRTARLLRETGAQVALRDETLGAWLRTREAVHVQNLARRALEVASAARAPASLQAEFALTAGAWGHLLDVVSEALEALRERGELERALRLAEAATQCAPEQRKLALRVEVMDLRALRGENALAAEHAEAVLMHARADAQTRGRARIAAGRAYVASGDLTRAATVLTDLPEDLDSLLRAQAARELARVHLRRGEHDAARTAVQQGLAVGDAADASRPELLSLEATLLGLAGKHPEAERVFDEALQAARSLGSVRDEAQVQGYRALSYERAGELGKACEAYAQSLAAARSAGDLGLTAAFALNLGNVSFRCGQTDTAADHFALAARMSRRAGRGETALLAQNNLAHVHLYLGAFERAQGLAEASLAEAERAGAALATAHAAQILGDVAARTGGYEAALVRYGTAAASYERLGRKRELVEVLLDTADALLNRAGVSDASDAAARLARARELTEAHGIEDLRLRLKLLLARARAANGDVEGASRDLERLLDQAPADADRELAWQLPAVQAQLYRWLGAELLARKKQIEAAEAIEREAARVPRTAREAYRGEPRRRAVLEAASELLVSSSTGSMVSSQASAPSGLAAQFARLLEVLKRLARERVLERLLERITDAAVELSGAERGFVLLVDGHGQLAPHMVRESPGQEHAAHVAFSRSIAEAVLIDGEPIVTLNARDDRRVNEFMSVHKLMLKSVACIPISGREGILGVLYLEHRLRAGRFQESDLDLLMAFADQAAIALENARLWSENERRQQELAEKNRELEVAKQHIEQLLEARTEELERAQEALSRARAELAADARRHGMVGQSAGLRRVFALIERVSDSSVPVVVEGESGTGKELVARAIHASSARRKGPFVAVNCGALPETLLESELFGHVRGAFTGADRDKKGLFAQAHGGTLFLDEFADVSGRMQLALLRVLQEGSVQPVGSDAALAVDVRVIVATHRSLKELVAERRVREDLYYRLNVVALRLPPLRERLEDVPLLCEHFLQRIAEKQGSRPKRLSRAALDHLLVSDFPGNVRQLEHLLWSAAVLVEGSLIEPRDLALEGGVTQVSACDETHAEREASSSSEAPPEATPGDLRSYKQRERQRILEALERHAWNRAKAAHALGMPRRTFYRRLSEFGIL